MQKKGKAERDNIKISSQSNRLTVFTNKNKALVTQNNLFVILKIATDLGTFIYTISFEKVTKGISQLIFYHVLNLHLELGMYLGCF